MHVRSNTAAQDPSANARSRRGFWLRTLHQWHWISAAICLAGMLLFAITGITLNHAARIEAAPSLIQHQAEVPAEVLASLRDVDGDRAPLPAPLRRWLHDEFGLVAGRREAEWTQQDVYLSMPGPGRDAWLSVDRHSGVFEYERTDRGWVSYLNDLHKGRNTGPAWAWFLDVFAIACIVFTLTGLFLLHMHARQRRTTWPWVGLGVVIPVLLALLAIH